MTEFPDGILGSCDRRNRPVDCNYARGELVIDGSCELVAIDVRRKRLRVDEMTDDFPLEAPRNRLISPGVELTL